MMQIYHILVGEGDRWCVNMFFDTRVTIKACKLLITSPEWPFSIGFRPSCVVRRALTPSQKLQGQTFCYVSFVGYGDEKL